MTLLLSRVEVQNLTKDSLFAFVSFKMPEGSQIDYKMELSGESKLEGYREFLKDVTAFANANGGILLLGVREPSEDIPTKDQVVGLDDGDNLAKDLERLSATSIDPRIPGLILKPVQIHENKYVIVVFIPPSLVRPHMVSHRTQRSFYIRHSESSVPMTTHEIRDTVLNSVTTEDRARKYAIMEEEEALEYIVERKPAFLLQAMPLLHLDPPWEVLSQNISKIVRGEGRNMKYDLFNLQSSVRPTPILKGVMGRESREENLWVTEIHRSGFVQAIYMDIQFVPNRADIFVLHDGYADLFGAFCHLVESLWRETQTDIPYMFRAKYFNAEKTSFLSSERPQKFTLPFGRRSIVWPDQFRQVGEPIEGIYRVWTQMLFHAFGLDWKLPEHKRK